MGSFQVTVNDRSAEALAVIRRMSAEDMSAFGGLVVEKARDFCPVLTGNLKRSIKFEKTGELSFKISTATGYGAFVELGIGQAPQPYLAPGAQEAVNEMDRIMSRG